MTTPLILPQFIVEAGFVAASPVSGAGTFILDDVTFGVLDTDTLGDSHTWTDITQWVLGFTITRASSRVQGPLIQFQAGTVSITLDNSDGRFDPDNLSGPYIAAGASQVRAMVPIRIRAVFASVIYPLFSGFADGWQETTTDYNAGYSEWVLTGTDGFKILSGINLASGGAVGGGENTGARMARLLTLAGWYSGSGDGARRLDTGDSTLQAVTLSGSVLDLMQTAVDSEIGQLYIDGSGAVVFRHRLALITDTRSNTSQATFGDNPAGSELPCAAIGRADDDTTIANDVQATIANGGTLQEVQDGGSITTYLFPRTYNRSDLLLQDDTTALLWAQWVLYISKSGEDRFDSLAVDPQAQPLDLWPQVLDRDIGDRITGIKRPSGGLFTVTRDVFITGATHTFDVASGVWLTTWTLSDASKYGSFLTLDNATLGQLDNNAMAF